jgi:hypothetical protein
MVTKFNIPPEAFEFDPRRVPGRVGMERNDFEFEMGEFGEAKFDEAEFAMQPPAQDQSGAAGEFYIEPEAFEFDPEFNEYERGWGELEDEFGEYEANRPPRPPAANLGDLAVRIDVMGHASPRWKTARNPSEADRLNQRLSELRATNVRKAVEQVLRTELPGLPITVPSKGLGSQQRFPSATEDNAAVDRSVVVTIDLTTTTPTYKAKARAPRRIYVPSKVWSLRVLDMARVGKGLPLQEAFLRVSLRNPYSGKEIRLSGIVFGGGAPTLFAAGRPKLSMPDVPQIQYKQGRFVSKPIGREVAFSTREALDFDDFKTSLVQLGYAELAFGLRTKFAYLKFVGLDTKPDMLIFDHKSFGLGFIKADAFLMAGQLKMEGANPGDWLELPSPPDLIPTQHTHRINDGLLLSFPTGKAGLNDLTPTDRKRLKDFVTNKARAIAALGESFSLSAPRP